MTVATTPRSVEYTAPGGSYGFAVPFQFYQIEVVTRVTIGGAETLVVPTDYVVTGGSGATGTVTYAPAADLIVTIRGKTRRGQTTRYGDFANFPMDAHQKSMDLIAMSVIEEDAAIADVAARALMVPRGESVPALPSLIGATAGSVLAYVAGAFVLAPNTTAAVEQNVADSLAAADAARADRVLADLDAAQTLSDRNVAAAQAAIAVAANGLPPASKYQSWASRTTPPSGVSTTQTYWVLDATASNLILYLNTSGTGAAATYGGAGVSWPLTPSLATLAADLIAATSYPDGTLTSVWIGASTLAAGSSPAIPGSQLLTISTTVTHDGTIDRLIVHTFDTADIHVRLMRGGVQVGADYVFLNAITIPQFITCNIPDARVGDKLRFTGPEFAYNIPAVAGDAGIDELDHTDYGFRIGARLTYSAGSIPLKTKVAQLAVAIGEGGGGGGTLPVQAFGWWGDSMSVDPPTHLAALTGLPVYGGGVSGEKSYEILARFLDHPELHDRGSILKFGRNNFDQPKQVMDDIQAAFDAVGPENAWRIIILPIWAGDGEYAGGSLAVNRPQIDALNRRIAARWPANFADSFTNGVYNVIDELGLTATSQDLIDVGHIVTPRQLRRSGPDYLHGNSYCDEGEARFVRDVAYARKLLLA